MPLPPYQNARRAILRPHSVPLLTRTRPRPSRAILRPQSTGRPASGRAILRPAGNAVSSGRAVGRTTLPTWRDRTFLSGRRCRDQLASSVLSWRRRQAELVMSAWPGRPCPVRSTLTEMSCPPRHDGQVGTVGSGAPPCAGAEHKDGWGENFSQIERDRFSRAAAPVPTSMVAAREYGVQGARRRRR